MFLFSVRGSSYGEVACGCFTGAAVVENRSVGLLIVAFFCADTHLGQRRAFGDVEFSDHLLSFDSLLQCTVEFGLARKSVASVELITIVIYRSLYFQCCCRCCRELSLFGNACFPSTVVPRILYCTKGLDHQKKHRLSFPRIEQCIKRLR